MSGKDGKKGKRLRNSFTERPPPPPRANDDNGTSPPQQRLRAASVIPVTNSESTAEPFQNPSPHQRSPGRQAGSPAIGMSPSPSAEAIGEPNLQIRKTSIAYNRKHRVSGIFAVDEMSVDLSVDAFPIDKQLELPPGSGPVAGSGILPVGTSGEEVVGLPPHPLSIAGSSIGGSSIGSYGLDDRERRQLYKPFRRKWRRFQRKSKGCLFALLSSFSSSLASYFVHHLTRENYSPSYCLLWRYCGVLIPGIIIVLYYRWWCQDKVFDTVWPFSKKEELFRFWLSIGRTVLDASAILLNYEAFKYLLQSETSTILNSKPIVVQLLAHFTLGEDWGVTPIIMSAFAAVGVIVISKPPFLVANTGDDSAVGRNSTGNFASTRLPGVLYSMGAMLLASVVYCILRYLRDVHYSVFSLFIGSGGVILGLALTFGLGEWRTPATRTDVIYLLSVAMLVCLSSITIVIALQNEEAFVVSLVRSCDVIFSFIWEMAIDQKYPDWYTGGGALIIMFCVGVIFLRKYISYESPNSRLFKAFHLLLK